jgi:hypothetical protein
MSKRQAQQVGQATFDFERAHRPCFSLRTGSTSAEPDPDDKT